MLKKNIKLIDTNIIIRFLVGDNNDLYEKSKDIFYSLETDELPVVILESVFAETIFVLSKVYKVERPKIKMLLDSIIDLKGVKNKNKDILKKSLEIFSYNNIDIVDALLCANHNSNTEILSFDRDIEKILKKNIFKNI